jgi:hypothetical protein
LNLVSNDSWFTPVGVLNRRTGKLERVPLDYPADFHAPGWTPHSRIISSAATLRAALWRYRPVATGK